MSPDELVYAATARCRCGAGMAYVKNPTRDQRYWDCSEILLALAVPSGQEGSKIHEDMLPFTFWEIKSENQPSAGGATTRPES